MRREGRAGDREAEELRRRHGPTSVWTGLASLQQSSFFSLSQLEMREEQEGRERRTPSYMTSLISPTALLLFPQGSKLSVGS